jgi:TM2 domain-containing membrane protein YozV
VKLEFKKLIKSTLNIFLSAFFILSFATVGSSNFLSAQNISDNNFSNDNRKKALFFSGLNQSAADSSDKTSGKFKMKKSPWKAVAFSAVLPGAGQFYNESYWKIPIIAGLGGYFGYMLIRNNNKYLDYKSQYQNSQTQQNPNGDQQLKSLREFYRDQRDNFIIYSLILYVVNLIDAYVDAQLYDFTVSDKIKIGLFEKDKFMKLSVGF